MPETPDPRSAGASDEAGPPDEQRHDHVSTVDALEDAAHDVVDAAAAARGSAAYRAHEVAAASGQVKDQATGRLLELEHAAREDDPRHWRALTACILAIVATAIDPPILQATSAGVQGALRVEPETTAVLVGLGYVIQAGAMVAGGVLGDRYGLRRVLLLGLAGMLAFGVVTATASTFAVVVIGHFGLSLSTAVVVPLSLASVMGTFGKRVLPVAIALYLTIQLLASLTAPAMAQFLFDRAGFGATLGPAIAMSALAFLAVRHWLAETLPGERMARLDAVALFAWSVGMLALVYATVAFAGGWGAGREAAVIVGGLLLLWAVSRLARDTTRLHLPHVPFRIVGVTLFTGAVLGISQSGSLLQLSNFLKGVQDYGDIASGVALAPYALTILIFSIATGVAMTRRYRAGDVGLQTFRRPVAGGLALVGVALLLLGMVREDSGYLLIGTALALLGTGASIANVPRTDLLFRSVRSDRVGVAAGLNGSSFLLGEALGNVVVTVMIAVTSAAAWQAQLVAGGMTPDAAAATYEEAMRAAFLATAHPFIYPSYLDVARGVPGWDQIFTDGFTGAMLVLAVVASVGAAVALLGLRGRASATTTNAT